jgi:NRPS condensation-like uncharacterized protein
MILVALRKYYDTAVSKRIANFSCFSYVYIAGGESQTFVDVGKVMLSTTSLCKAKNNLITFKRVP